MCTIWCRRAQDFKLGDLCVIILLGYPRKLNASWGRNICIFLWWLRYSYVDLLWDLLRLRFEAFETNCCKSWGFQRLTLYTNISKWTRALRLQKLWGCLLLWHFIILKFWSDDSEFCFDWKAFVHFFYAIQSNLDICKSLCLLLLSCECIQF